MFFILKLNFTLMLHISCQVNVPIVHITHYINNNNPNVLVSCCRNGQPDPFMNADVCLPQLMLPNDEFYSKFGVTCIDMKRSINTRMLGCDLRPCAQVKLSPHINFDFCFVFSFTVKINMHVNTLFQINYETGYLDLSILYGPEQATAINLRTHNRGQLKTSVFNKQQFPPVTSGGDCAADAACFVGG